MEHLDSLLPDLHLDQRNIIDCCDRPFDTVAKRIDVANTVHPTARRSRSPR